METCCHPLNHGTTCRHHNSCSLSKLCFQVNVITCLVLGAIYLPLAQIKCFWREREKSRRRKEKPLGWIYLESPESIILLLLFLILIQFSNANLDSLLCVYPHPPTDSTCMPDNLSYKFWSVFLSRTALFCCSLCLECGWKLLALIILSIPFELF